jgi:predicted transcriptional regulator
MPRKPSPHPNEVELQILRVLWQAGPSTARQIHEALSAARETGITSTTKMLHVMVGKGLLRRNKGRPVRFRAAEPAEATQANIVEDVVDRVFGGAAEKLIVRAVESHPLTPEQLAEIRQLLDKLEGTGP